MMALWYTEEFDDQLRISLKVHETLLSQRSEHQHVEVFQTELLGRVLAIDGILMTSEVDEANYHELLVQVPLCTAPRLRNVLIIGGGDGGSAREVLLHPEVERCVLVEIDGVVIEASKKYLSSIGTAWDDPRLEVIVGDGIDYVAKAADESFDVVILDGSDPVGPAEGLFDEQFYKHVARILPADGIFALQSESPLLFEKVFYELQTALRNVFGRSFPYFRSVPLYGTGIWSFTYASKLADPMALNDERVQRVEAKSKVYNADIHRGVFAVPQDIKRRLGDL